MLITVQSLDCQKGVFFGKVNPSLELKGLAVMREVLPVEFCALVAAEVLGCQSEVQAEMTRPSFEQKGLDVTRLDAGRGAPMGRMLSEVPLLVWGEAEVAGVQRPGAPACCWMVLGPAACQREVPGAIFEPSLVSKGLEVTSEVETCEDLVEVAPVGDCQSEVPWAKVKLSLVVKGLEVMGEVPAGASSRLSGWMESPPVWACKTGVGAVASMMSVGPGTVKKLLLEPMMLVVVEETGKTLGDVKMIETGPADPREMVVVPDWGEPPETLAEVNPAIFALLIDVFSCWLAVVEVGELRAESRVDKISERPAFGCDGCELQVSCAFT
jgi:hypothetical protein